MSKRSFPLLDLLLLESRVKERVVERSVGVSVVVSNSEISAIIFQIARSKLPHVIRALSPCDF